MIILPDNLLTLYVTRIQKIEKMDFQKVPIANLFLNNCYLYPENKAIFINKRHYTYAELLQKVYSIYSQMANHDQLFQRIGVYCTNDIETYASILAISLYGAAFVPLNSNFPIRRNQAIIEAADLSSIVNCEENTFKNECKNITFFSSKNELSGSNKTVKKDHFERKVDQELAYILFTSGTTGKPKGVPVSNENVWNFFSFYLNNPRFAFTPNDRFIQVFELTFDVSIFSFFMPLHIGACCYVTPQKGIRFLEIIQILKEHQITVSTLVPTVLQYIEKYIDEIDFPHMKYSFFIGDKLNHSIVSKWAKKIKNAEIINFYGPTEATIMCTSYTWNESDSLQESNNDIVPIGKPFQNIEYVIISDNNQSIEKEEVGELYLTGKQIVTSYLNHSNEERFVELKSKSGTVKRFYKTGDLASINSKGNLLFHGRIDRQVKINGHRVELNEIEEHIRRLTNDVFYIGCFSDKKNVNQLVLFVEKNERKIDFKEALAKSLPEYMLPTSTIILHEIPFNYNSKVDEKKLQELFLNKG